MCQNQTNQKWEHPDLQDQRYIEREGAKKIEARISETSQSILRKCDLFPVRIKSIDIQNQGVDYIIDLPEKRMFVDEKAAYCYWDRDLQTYAVEITNILNTNNHSGWFLNERAITTHYLFVWPRSTEKTMQHITRWEGILIEKELLKKLYHMIGYSKEELETLVTERGKETKNTGKCFHLYKKYVNGCYESLRVFLATSHIEQNVNLVIPKSWLIPLASKHIIWEEDKGLVLNRDQTPDIPDSVKKICYQIKKNKLDKNEHKITA